MSELLQVQEGNGVQLFLPYTNIDTNMTKFNNQYRDLLGIDQYVSNSQLETKQDEEISKMVYNATEINMLNKPEVIEQLAQGLQDTDRALAFERDQRLQLQQEDRDALVLAREGARQNFEARMQDEQTALNEATNKGVTDPIVDEGDYIVMKNMFKAEADTDINPWAVLGVRAGIPTALAFGGGTLLNVGKSAAVKVAGGLIASEGVPIGIDVAMLGDTLFNVEQKYVNQVLDTYMNPMLTSVGRVKKYREIINDINTNVPMFYRGDIYGAIIRSQPDQWSDAGGAATAQALKVAFGPGVQAVKGFNQWVANKKGFKYNDTLGKDVEEILKETTTIRADKSKPLLPEDQKPYELTEEQRVTDLSESVESTKTIDEIADAIEENNNAVTINTRLDDGVFVYDNGFDTVGKPYTKTDDIIYQEGQVASDSLEYKTQFDIEDVTSPISGNTYSKPVRTPVYEEGRIEYDFNNYGKGYNTYTEAAQAAKDIENFLIIPEDVSRYSSASIQPWKGIRGRFDLETLGTGEGGGAYREGLYASLDQYNTNPASRGYYSPRFTSDYLNDLYMDTIISKDMSSNDKRLVRELFSKVKDVQELEKEPTTGVVNIYKEFEKAIDDMSLEAESKVVELKKDYDELLKDNKSTGKITSEIRDRITKTEDVDELEKIIDEVQSNDMLVDFWLDDATFLVDLASTKAEYITNKNVRSTLNKYYKKNIASKRLQNVQEFDVYNTADRSQYAYSKKKDFGKVSLTNEQMNQKIERYSDHLNSMLEDMQKKDATKYNKILKIPDIKTPEKVGNFMNKEAEYNILAMAEYFKLSDKEIDDAIKYGVKSSVKKNVRVAMNKLLSKYEISGNIHIDPVDNISTNIVVHDVNNPEVMSDMKRQTYTQNGKVINKLLDTGVDVVKMENGRYGVKAVFNIPTRRAGKRRLTRISEMPVEDLFIK